MARRSIQMNHSYGLSPPPAPKLTHGTTPIRFARGKATKFSSRDRSGVEQPRHEVPDFSLISLVPPKRTYPILEPSAELDPARISFSGGQVSTCCQQSFFGILLNGSILPF
ncbi:hypothetical protein M5K25_028302 [Dendrobium thyrsiflorum]|uniref:Uncharacterized protein n=1 Tax=Dendrobium thyrsiflorum TaxID=117978 RepID=A0ABD0TTP2_DENTH